MTLPVALGGHDIIGQAKTGTGKTLGLRRADAPARRQPQDEAFATLSTAGKPQALVVVPTRELAVQVAGDLERAGKARGVRVLTVYGGRAYEPQIEALQRGVEIVVGTPGRLIDLAKQGHLDLSAVRSVVLDEADEMLDLGFLPDVEKLLALTPASRQTMLFSATMPGAVVALARRYMTQPTHIRAMGEARGRPHGQGRRAVRLPRPRDGQGRDAGPDAAGQGPRAHHHLQPHQAHRRQGRRRAGRPRLRRRGHPRRPRPGRPRAGAARVPQRQGRHPRRHRRGRPRHRRRERHPRHQLPVPRGREDLPAPHRAHRPRRQHRCRRDLRRLGRPAALGPDQQGRSTSASRSRRRPTPPPTTSSPTWTSPAGPPGGCPRAARPAPGWQPSRSRTSARPASPPAAVPAGAAPAGAARAGRPPRAAAPRRRPLRRWPLIEPVPLPRPAHRRQRPSGRRRDR